MYEHITPTLAARARALEPTCGKSAVLAIDGRAGSGKSTLAAEMVAELGCPLVQMESLYPGWNGLANGINLLVSDVLEPLSRGLGANVPQYNWHTSTFDEPARLEPPALLIVEGVGCGALKSAEFIGELLWLELDADERQRRALARESDGAAFAEHWNEWAAQEEALLAVDPINERADLSIFQSATLGR
jgi:uridine kinase